MSRTIFHATTALGLCLAVVPLTASAQCADAREYTRCEFLFQDASAVFEVPAQREQAQELMAQLDAVTGETGDAGRLSDADAEEAVLRLRIALDAAAREAGVATGDTPGTAAPTGETDERAEDDRRARLRAEADALAVEAPELVVEAVPEQEFVARADAQRQLDAEQRTALEQLMADPDVAAALALLGGLSEPGEEDEAQDQPRSEYTAALFALQRAQRGEVGGDEPEAVIDAVIAADEIRSSSSNFGSRLVLDFNARQALRDNRSDLERAGLGALGALAVGMSINRSRVVVRSDERVVVMRDDGEFAIWRDDDVLLRREGSERQIERHADGSTLTRWTHRDGSWSITIRDATGRVHWRERILPDGTSIELVNDMGAVEPIDVATLPPPLRRELLISQRTDPELALALLGEAEVDARALGRTFALRQVREMRALRDLLPALSPEPIAFETNRANIRAEEVRKLAQIGRLLERLIADNPRELFLIEGYTDATGPASYNLALSDRRAESVALALSEFFDIPPENLIIQGYGELHLRIPTDTIEALNRRVAIRRISPLLGP